MKVTKIRNSLSWRSWCYFEAQVWKRDSNIVPSLLFSHLFIWASLASFFSLFLFGLLWPLLFFIKSGDSSRLVGESLLPSSFPHMGQCSNNEDHHSFIYLQLKKYNSILRTKYDSMWMPPVVYRDMQWIKSDMYERIIKVALPQIRCQLHDHAKAIWQWWSVS